MEAATISANKLLDGRKRYLGIHVDICINEASDIWESTYSRAFLDRLLFANGVHVLRQ